VIYDIYGEGIHGYGYTAEYNVVGDTASAGIYVCPSNSNATDTVIRYNLVVSSGSDIYKNNGVSGKHGIGVANEVNGGDGDNSDATVEIYGNIVINRNWGILIADADTTSPEPWGAIKVYNNMVIDSVYRNYYLHKYSCVLAGEGYFYNNSSIFYDRDEGDSYGVPDHALDQDNPANLSTYWTIDHNHFYCAACGTQYIDSDWQTNYVTSDPKLPGESLVNWTGLTGRNYFYLIDFEKHLYIPINSGLVNSGKILGEGFNSMFLTAGTDFSKSKFQRKSQPNSSKWHIGPIIPNDEGPSSTYVGPPTQLKLQ
jgi:hypothetical protein